VIFTVAVSVPPRLVAETVKLVADSNVVGVPERTPVIVLKFSPAGSVGVIAQLEAGPPELIPFRFTLV
jgi:hypothetical protein